MAVSFLPKWYIRKYSVEHFLENRPIVQIFREFHNKSTDFNEFFLQFRDSFNPHWLKIKEKIYLSKFEIFTMEQKFYFLAKHFFVPKCFFFFFLFGPELIIWSKDLSFTCKIWKIHT
jgi:hypothetical protein